jgi:hypothetical protein
MSTRENAMPDNVGKHIEGCHEMHMAGPSACKCLCHVTKIGPCCDLYPYPHSGCEWRNQSPPNRIDAMVNAFLSWPLPDTFSPDGGISFDRTANGKDRRELGSAWWPVGTNLLTADEARQMFEYVLNGTQRPPKEERESTQPAPDQKGKS